MFLKRLLIFAAFVVASHSIGPQPASGQEMFYVGTVSLYTDSLFTSSTAIDSSATTLAVHVVHDNLTRDDTHSAIQFQTIMSPGFTGVWTHETSPHPTVVGASPTGVSIGYGDCLVGPTYLMTIYFSLSGSSETNSFIEVVPHPNEPTNKIVTVPCVGYLNYCDGGRITVNSTVPIAESTWGRVKAMFAQ